jgi:hypothetical protein
MAEATGPPLPLGIYPNGVDTSHPKYAINSDTWLEPPKQFTENHMNTASMTIKTSINLAYKSAGNANTWNTYILFGYHAYNHCFQFDTHWERMRQNQPDVKKFVWESYCYLISIGMKIPKKTSDGRKTLQNPTYQHITQMHSSSTPWTLVVHEETMRMKQTFWTPKTTTQTRKYQQTTTRLQSKANRNTDHPTHKHQQLHNQILRQDTINNPNQQIFPSCSTPSTQSNFHRTAL